jgi:hypothetical protein
LVKDLWTNGLFIMERDKYNRMIEDRKITITKVPIICNSGAQY